MINHLSVQKNQQIPMADEQDVTVSLTSQRLKYPSELENTSNDIIRWQDALANAVTDLDELLYLVELEHIKPTLYVPNNFGLRVPRAFIDKMEPSNPQDPLLLQVLPSGLEKTPVTGYVTDPLAENDQNPTKGLLHKYRSRLLMTVTGACAIHCRYCFRQHFDYLANMPTSRQFDDITTYIEDNPDVNEVILSGGDPLSVTNRRLFLWLDRLESLPQITTIRLHTRLPIVIPERLDADLLARLHSSRCRIVMVVHTNHANEIDTYTKDFLLKAKAAGIIMLNQAVLLAGINDTLETQVALSTRLFEAGVLPYYLHLLDKVSGAAHFDMQQSKAVSLYWQMLEQLPGYLMPKLVQELPHKPFKTPVNLYANRIQS